MTNPHNSSHSPDEQEITLRCSKCGKPITPAEAVQTPTGYRCRDCVKQQQKIFDTSRSLDYVWGLLIAVLLSFVGSYLTSFIRFFTFLLAPAAGVAVAEVVRIAVKKRRSKRLFKLVSIGVVIGAVPLIILFLIGFIRQLGAGLLNLYNLLPLGYQVLYLVLAVPSAYYRLSGGRRY